VSVSSFTTYIYNAVVLLLYVPTVIIPHLIILSLNSHLLVKSNSLLYFKSIPASAVPMTCLLNLASSKNKSHSTLSSIHHHHHHLLLKQHRYNATYYRINELDIYRQQSCAYRCRSIVSPIYSDKSL